MAPLTIEFVDPIHHGARGVGRVLRFEASSRGIVGLGCGQVAASWSRVLYSLNSQHGIGGQPTRAVG